MRSITEIQNDYAKVACEVGQIELEKTRILFAADAKLAPLHQKADDLLREFKAAKELESELEKSKAIKLSDLPAV
jgi:hypothetical protein